MKKSLLAIAVAAALPGFAQAQSSLTMFGVLDASLQWGNSDANSSYTITPATPASAALNAAGVPVVTPAKPASVAKSAGSSGFTLANGVGMGSRFGVRGSEDLGGGMRAIFTLEHRFDVTDGDTSGSGSTGRGDTTNNKFWNGQAWVGLSSGWGQVTAGRQYTPIFWALYPADFTEYRYYNNWAAPTGSTIATLIPQGPVRLDNSISYKSPTFGGLTVYAVYAFGENIAAGTGGASGTDTLGTGDVYGIAAGWQLGGLYIGGGYHSIDSKPTATVGNAVVGGVPTVGQSVAAITASYKWQSFGVSLGYTQVNFQQFYAGTTNKSNVNNILASAFMNVGTGKVLLNFYNTNNHDFKSIVAPVNGNATNSFGLTYEYPLSKRTFMYVAGGMSDFSNFQVNGTSRLKPQQVALGFRHLF
jgi:predicted porin